MDSTLIWTGDLHTFAIFRFDFPPEIELITGTKLSPQTIPTQLIPTTKSRKDGGIDHSMVLRCHVLVAT